MGIQGLSGQKPDTIVGIIRPRFYTYSGFPEAGRTVGGIFVIIIITRGLFPP